MYNLITCGHKELPLNETLATFPKHRYTLDQAIFTLVNDRYEQRDRLLTVFASNKAPADLPQELGYMTSRFTQGEIVNVPGPDMRPAVKEVEDWRNR